MKLIGNTKKKFLYQLEINFSLRYKTVKERYKKT